MTSTQQTSNNEEIFESKLPRDEDPQDGGNDETSQ